MKYQKGKAMIVLQVADRKFLDRMMTPTHNIYEDVVRLRQSFTKAEFDSSGGLDGPTASNGWSFEDRKEATMARAYLNTKLSKIIKDCQKLEQLAKAFEDEVRQTKP